MGLLQVVDRCFDTPILTQGPHAPFNDVEPTPPQSFPALRYSGLYAHENGRDSTSWDMVSE